MNDEIGAACRDLRHALGITQSELADQLGCSRQHISDVERGRPTAQSWLLWPRVIEMAAEMRQRQVVAPPVAVDQGPLDEALSSAEEVAEFVRTQRRPLESDESRRSVEGERRDFERLAWCVGAKLVCEIIEHPFSEEHQFCHPGPWHVVRAYFESKGVTICCDAPEIDPSTFARWPLHLVVREGHRRALLALSVGLAAANDCQDCVGYWSESIDAARAMFLTQNDSAGR
jgi:transcriptional regulator with XRE-family HTH domain